MAAPLGLFIQPACLQHKYIRHPNSSHIFERPERLRAVLLGVAAAVARLEAAESTLSSSINPSNPSSSTAPSSSNANDDLSSLLSSLSIASASTQSFALPRHLHIVPPPTNPRLPGQILQHHPAVQLAHSPPPDEGLQQASLTASSTYLKDLVKWCNEAIDRIKETGSEIPSGLGLNQGDLYLGPGTILAIEGAIQTVCQAIDRVCEGIEKKEEPVTPPDQTGPNYFDAQNSQSRAFRKAFCAIRPPGHHCGENEPSGFCYVNNVVVGALHAYLEHDIDRAIIIDFDLHHGNGTQALVMPLNAASYAEELAVKAGKPTPPIFGKKGKRRRNWQSFYGSVHDIYSYPCEDGDIDLIKDASISLAAHGQYVENIHLQPYSSEEDFYERIYPKYLTLLEKARVFMEETSAEPDRTIILISAGFDAFSFFSRYTKDIVTFANRYTEGKVVSVLEGGYSDRALTSAAMGHIIGLLDRSGDPTWWTENELVNIEKATKKRRTGKIAPFPSELSSHSHLVRTHALLSYFEGTPLETPAPSVTNTPQQGSRMTLRNRQKAFGGYGEDEVAVTPPARRGGRVKTGATPKTTPVKLKVEDVPLPIPQVPSKPIQQIKTDPTPAITVSSEDQDLLRSMQELGRGSLGEDGPSKLGSNQIMGKASAQYGSDAIKTDTSILPTAGPPSTDLTQANPASTQQTDQQRIFLRFPRPSPSQTPQPNALPPNSSLYPSIPGLPVLTNASTYRDPDREQSAGLSTESESEYVSARSDLSDNQVEAKAER